MQRDKKILELDCRSYLTGLGGSITIGFGSTIPDYYRSDPGSDARRQQVIRIEKREDLQPNYGTEPSTQQFLKRGCGDIDQIL
jgi:hypothetical protein